MSMVLAVSIGALVTAGVYQLLGGNLFRICFGIYILLNALNLLVLSMAANPDQKAPLSQLGEPHTDPLVQAMVLTAIVISFGVSTFILLLTARLVRKYQTVDTEKIRGWKQ